MCLKISNKKDIPWGSKAELEKEEILNYMKIYDYCLIKPFVLDCAEN